jgi:hypothetical protein
MPDQGDVRVPCFIRWPDYNSSKFKQHWLALPRIMPCEN